MLGREAVLPDTALYLPTFNHLSIVNYLFSLSSKPKLRLNNLSLSLSLSRARSLSLVSE
jgi:hypothetical protein